MADDVVGKERLAIFIPVKAPGIGGSIHDHFEDVSRRMVAQMLQLS